MHELQQLDAHRRVVFDLFRKMNRKSMSNQQLGVISSVISMDCGPDELAGIILDLDAMANRFEELPIVKDKYGRAPMLVDAGDTAMVVSPLHYASFPYEPVRFCVDIATNPFEFNIIKYVCRHKMKNGVEDLRKAARYAEMYLKWMTATPGWWS